MLRLVTFKQARQEDESLRIIYEPHLKNIVSPLPAGLALSGLLDHLKNLKFLKEKQDEQGTGESGAAERETKE